MNNYLYKYGDIEVYKKFQEPTREIFYQWRSEFLSNVNLDNYNVLYMGNSAERLFGVSTIPTFDIDIILSGKIDSYQKLFNTLTTAFKIGLRYNLCIDIFHANKDVFKNNIWNDYRQIRFYQEIIDSTNTIFPIEHDGIEKLSHGLYCFYKKNDTNKSLHKYLSRVQSGDYLSLKYDLKTMKLISFN